MFELYINNAAAFRFRLKASNGQIILASQNYESKDGCENGIASVQNNASDEANFDKLESTNDKPYFNLKASNGQVIGTSEMYESTNARDNGIASVMTNAPSAEIRDIC